MWSLEPSCCFTRSVKHQSLVYVLCYQLLYMYYVLARLAIAVSWFLIQLTGKITGGGIKNRCLFCIPLFLYIAFYFRSRKAESRYGENQERNCIVCGAVLMMSMIQNPDKDTENLLTQCDKSMPQNRNVDNEVCRSMFSYLTKPAILLVRNGLCLAVCTK